ncbi:MAG: hypothetical protein JO152_13295 [Mycobacteriaceae bacterium]|nr:hypothetical protein [Mycobacteriaceae bacterium]
MTTGEQFRSIVAPGAPAVPIAGVPWPRYKVIAIVLGVVVSVLTGLLTINAAPAVLAGAASAAVVWLALGALQRPRR